MSVIFIYVLCGSTHSSHQLTITWCSLPMLPYLGWSIYLYLVFESSFESCSVILSSVCPCYCRQGVFSEEIERTLVYESESSRKATSAPRVRVVLVPVYTSDVLFLCETWPGFYRCVGDACLVLSMTVEMRRKSGGQKSELLDTFYRGGWKT